MADNGKKVVVFGGSGFLGSHVAEVLGDQGYDVTIFDIKPSPHAKPGQQILIGDILDADSVRKAVAGARYVYHFAGLANINTAHTVPLETVRQNILGTCHILDACAQERIDRLIFASTVYVYSRHGTFYSASKQSCELYIDNYQKVYGLPYTILRYGSLYGSRAGEQNAIYRMVKQALVEGKIVYPGDGEELRDYIHVDDAARMSVQALAPEYKNQHLILNGPQSMRVKDLMLMIKEIIGTDIRMEFDLKGEPERQFTHYRITPYSFTPQLGRRLVSQHYIDLGQGLLRCMEEVQMEQEALKRRQILDASKTQR